MTTLTIGILTALVAFAAQATTLNRFHPNHLLVKMKAGEAAPSSSLIQDSRKIIGNLYLVKTTNLQALKSQLQESEQVEYVQNDFFAGKRHMPKHEVLDPISMQMKMMFVDNFANFNDPHAARLWAFADDAGNGMSVTSGYDVVANRTLKSVIVAVVDTGVDHTHEDLKDVMWTNPKEIAGNNKDDDNNGYIDDIHGINTLVRDASGNATMNTMASHWHGTHVAGTIAATQNNGVGIAGVASNVKIMAIRTVPDDADELDSDVAEAYVYAAKMGAKVINCSFGKAVNEGGMVVRDTINEIGKKYGTLVIASAGNDSMGPFSWHDNDVDPKYPAAFDSPNMIVVASTTASGGLSSFSNIGANTVDVAAPGSNIYSTMVGNKYGMASGTSMAAPNTSGVAAMIIGANPTLKTAALVKKVMMASVTKVPAFAGKMTSGGRVNMKAALTTPVR